MRINQDYIKHWSGDELVIVAVGDSADQFNGLVRANGMVEEIYDLMIEDTTKDEIVDKIYNKYKDSVSREDVDADVEYVLEKFREIKAIID